MAFRIKNVETFNIEIPATPTEVEAGVTNRTAVVRVETESGVRGYSFGAAGGGGGRGGAATGFALIREALVGADLFAMEQHLKRGLINWGGIEEALWLEEPFARDDFEGPERLAREMDILITGGEGFRGLDAYRECMMHDTYDIIQPDLRTVGGLLTMRKVAALCEAYHKPCIGHGAFGLAVAGRIQAHAAWGAPLEELALATPPPLLPQEQWAPASKILHGKELYTFRNGELLIPQGPGLGLDLDEEAVEHYRV